MLGYSQGSMTPAEFEQLQKLFLELRESSNAAREQRLSQLHENAPEQEKFLREMLAHDSQNDTFLENPIARKGDEDGTSLTDTHSYSESNESIQPIRQIGPYRILQQIGEGGHGLVFMAGHPGVLGMEMTFYPVIGPIYQLLFQCGSGIFGL